MLSEVEEVVAEGLAPQDDAVSVSSADVVVAVAVSVSSAEVEVAVAVADSTVEDVPSPLSEPLPELLPALLERRQKCFKGRLRNQHSPKARVFRDVNKLGTIGNTA